MKKNSDSFSELLSLCDELLPEQANLTLEDPIPPAGDDFKNHDLDSVDHAQDIFLKKVLVKNVLIITYVWLGFLIIFFMSSGACNAFQGKTWVSDAVLITLVSGTSLSVIMGMLSIILRHLFAGKQR